MATTSVSDDATQRPHLLYLVHRIPFPPRKGDKVRSYHQLKYLAQRYRVHLGTFVDDAADLEHIETVRGMCETLCVQRLHPRLARIFSARAFLYGGALSVAYFANAAMMQWARQVTRENDIKRLLVFSSSMGQYAVPLLNDNTQMVVDFVDVDSEKWRNYAALNSGPMGWVYAREGRKLLAYERMLATRASAGTFVTEEEAALFNKLAPESTTKIHDVRNGVDASYFDPALSFEAPYDAQGPVAVFTGAMDYHANVDAVLWFVQNVWPAVREAVPGARFFVVGANPLAQLRALGGSHGITVTGTVDDVRPYLAHASLAVAPLRVARGIQNKVLEAMAMQLPVVGTQAAVEGIEQGHGLTPWIADEPEQLVERLNELLLDPAARERGKLGREFVLSRYDWSASVAELASLIESSQP